MKIKTLLWALGTVPDGYVSPDLGGRIDQWPILSDTQTFRFPGVKQPAVLFPVTAAEGHREYPEDAEGRGSVSNSSDPPL